MSCESARDLVEQYLDGELDISVSVQMREHLEVCCRCAEEYHQFLRLRADIQNEAPYYRAPTHLYEQVHAALHRARKPTGGNWRWLAMAACLFLAVSLGWNVALLRSRDSEAASAAQDVLASHVRSLMGAHLTDVASSDQHNVKPWFNGKLNFSPDVKDFAAQGFPLAGGRLDYILGIPAAALVYRQRQHVINLLTWPSAASGNDSDVLRNGYYAIHWGSAGMTYWAVSDLTAGELRQFVSLYQESVPAGK